ncbi:MAG: DUF6445 family protein [Cellvibrio sp.]|uniref:DUF6445 family protein n=1 Tax=Cellvibrio sp. TaxID=1965322 RepID=UPI00272696DC|nr:DUF6445 family protein [Cellvibrio sp.]
MQLHPDFSCRVDYVGNEQQPVLVVDNFLSDPVYLVEFCARHTNLNKVDALYPGLRASAPDNYIQLIYCYLRDTICTTFAIDDSMVTHVKADYSMVLTPVNQLKLTQCLPHYDSLNSSELAAVHYLCGSDKGGTSLYRHRDTGFEYVDSSRAAFYTEQLRSGINNVPYPQRYMNGSNQLFEQIASYEAVFNRMIIYRCTSLHSGDIAPDFLFDSNPRTGRLTINTFIGL